MTLSFHSTRVTTPNASPTSSTTGGTYYVRHRRVNLDGGYTLWSNAVSEVALPALITPQSYGDSDQLLRDEILISEDDITYKIVPRPANGVGEITIAAYSSSWTTTTNQDTQNSILSSLDFGSFSNLSEPARTLYIFNSSLSKGSLTFNFLETVTNQVASEYSGLILVELLGVIGATGQNLSTSYNSQFLWVSPNLGLNTLALILPSSGFAKVRITLTNFPTGGLSENTIQLALQVTANQKKFPLSYGLDWANKTLLYSPNTGFNFPFISSADGLTVTVDSFLFNYNGVLVGQFSAITLNLSEGVGDYTLTVNPNGTVQAWHSTETVPDNTQTLAEFTTSLVDPFIDTITYTVGLRPQVYGQVDEPVTNMFARFISIDATNQAQLEATTPNGVYVGNGYFAISGTVLLETLETIAIGDNLTTTTNGYATVDSEGFLVARSDDFYGYVLADFYRSTVIGGGTGVDIDGNNSAFTYTNYTPSTAPAYQEGRVWYSSADDALSYYDNISGTSIQIGKELVLDARNDTGSTILNGKVVYISGATGQYPTITLARADAIGTSRVIGVATHDIPNNTIGKVTISGAVNDLDTSAFSDGDAVYLSASTAGNITATTPTSPNFVVPVGYIAHAHVTQGKLIVSLQRPLANNNSLGTSELVAPTQNAVKEYIDANAGGLANPVDILYFSPFTLTWSSGATMDNSLHNVFKLTVNSTGTLAHSNVPASPDEYWFRLYLTISSGTFTPPASWNKGMVCPTAVGSYVIEGLTDDGGTSFIIGVIYL